jgi:hypothetical protein
MKINSAAALAIAICTLAGCNKPAGHNQGTPSGSAGTVTTGGTSGTTDVTGPGGPTVIALTAGECKQLGGKVEADPVCGGLKQKCTTVTLNPVTGAGESHSLCIDKAD